MKKILLFLMLLSYSSLVFSSEAQIPKPSVVVQYKCLASFENITFSNNSLEFHINGLSFPIKCLEVIEGNFL